MKNNDKILKEKSSKDLTKDFKIKIKLFPYISNAQLINNLKIDNESIHYISIRDVSEEITKIIKYHCEKLKINCEESSILDGTAGVGGNTLSFAYDFKKVYAVEIDKLRSDYLNNNITVYKFNNIEVYNDDCLNLYNNLEYDVLFLDPPWGGRDYKRKELIQLKLSGRTIETVCKEVFDCNKKCKLIVIKIPFNFDLYEFYNRLHFISRAIYIHELKKMNLLVVYYV
jgi:16S rRNA G966 N2-methylase RsmD